MKLILMIAVWFTATQTLPVFGKTKKPMKRETASVPEAQIPAPVANEVCFSPEGNCDVKLWKFLQGAKKSLDIAIFDLTHEKIAHEIAVASKRIPVRVIVDRRQAKGNHSVVPTLIRAGVDVRFGYQRGIMHNKFCLKDQTWLETGSFNFTSGASTKNNENQIYLNHPEIVQKYQNRFNDLWEVAVPATSQISRH